MPKIEKRPFMRRTMRQRAGSRQEMGRNSMAAPTVALLKNRPFQAFPTPLFAPGHGFALVNHS
jgi:hypothetical protein